MKQWSRTKVMKGLQRMVSDITHLKTSEEFGLKKGGIWTTGAENGWIYKGMPPFDCDVEYGELPLSYAGYTDPKHKDMKVKTMYVNGVHREIHNWLEERGWYPKWYDGGTLFFWKDTRQSDLETLEYLVGDKQKGWLL